MGKIDERTAVPIGLAVVAIGGGAAWMTRMDIQQTAQASQLVELRGKADTLNTTLFDAISRIDMTLARINTHLEYLRKRRANGGRAD